MWSGVDLLSLPEMDFYLEFILLHIALFVRTCPGFKRI